MKVEQFYNKNQFVIRSDKKVVFQSYDSTVCEITNSNDKIVLGRDWDYSKTTMKHLYLFLDCYGSTAVRSALNNTNNKRKTIEKLIKEKVIKYNSNLR